jgi:probable dihydroxyacetone kinase regulator
MEPIIMDNSEHKTKYLLTQSFKEIVKKYPFEKITIKMITDRSGVIRPTFYNYFKDKNEVFEWILEEELFNTLHNLILNNMENEAIKMIFQYFGNNRNLYSKLFTINGQNSFEEVFEQDIHNFFIKILEKYDFKINKKLLLLSRENISKYYCMGMVYIIKTWMLDEKYRIIPSEDMYEGYIFLLTHSLLDIFEK